MDRQQTDSTLPKEVFVCTDELDETADEYVNKIQDQLLVGGLRCEQVSFERAVGFVREGQLGDGKVLCLAPITLEGVNRVAEAISSSGRAHTGFQGVALPHTVTADFRSSSMRHLFGTLTTQGFHLAHPELDGEETWSDPVKIADIILCETKHTRYVSNQIGDTVSVDLLEKYEAEFRAALAEIFAAKLFNGMTDGSLSLRLDNGRMLCTASRTPKEPSQFTVDRLVLIEECVPAGNLVKWMGRLAPTSSTPWHSILYNRMPNISAIVHTHARQITYSTAADAERIRSASYSKYGLPTVADSIQGILSQSPVAILRGHGEVSVGESFSDAVDTLISLKENVASDYHGPS